MKSEKPDCLVRVNNAISTATILALVVLHLTSCATRPAGSKAPVVEAGMPAQGPASAAPPIQSSTESPEQVTTFGYAPEEVQAPVPLPGPVTEPTPTGTAVLALLETADLQRADGQLAAAAASLERALRIEPQNPWTWYRLAAVRLEQGRLNQAEQLARRADSLAGTDNEVRARASRLIALIRERRGDPAAARQQANETEP